MGYNGDLYPTAGADVVMTTKGDMVDYDTARQRLGIGSANQILQVKSSLPSWETVPLADTVLTTGGDILYENNTPELARLAKGSDADVLTLASGLPSWAAPTSGGVWSKLQDVELTVAGQLSSGSFTAHNNLDIWCIGANTISQNTAMTFNGSGATAYKNNIMVDGVYASNTGNTEIAMYGGNTSATSFLHLHAMYDKVTSLSSGSPTTAYWWQGTNQQTGSGNLNLSFSGWGYYYGALVTQVDKSQYGAVAINQQVGSRIIVYGAN